MISKIQLMIFISIVLLSTNIYADNYKANGITFIPVRHASFIIQTKQHTIFVDPVGKIESYKEFPLPDLILITHTHPDHLSLEILNKLRVAGAVIVGPKAVIEQVPSSRMLENGQKEVFSGVSVEAVPAYNTTKERLQFHPKGRDNGYVLTLNKKRIYISGDTEDTPELRALKNIDFAFLCMNLPYTMTVDQAVSVLKAFQPKVVFPYHYKNQGGLSDLEKLKQNLADTPNIEVRLLSWY